MMRPSILTLLFSLAAVRLVAADKTALLAIKAAFEKAQVSFQDLFVLGGV